MVKNNLYLLKKIDQNRYLVFGNSYMRIEDLFSSIGEELKRKRFSGELILDLLLSNGNNNSRFFQMNFEGGLLIISSLRKIKSPEKVVLELVNSYIKEHQNLLSDSVLSSYEVEQLISSL